MNFTFVLVRDYYRMAGYAERQDQRCEGFLKLYGSPADDAGCDGFWRDAAREWRDEARRLEGYTNERW